MIWMCYRSRSEAIAFAVSKRCQRTRPGKFLHLSLITGVSSLGNFGCSRLGQAPACGALNWQTVARAIGAGLMLGQLGNELVAKLEHLTQLEALASIADLAGRRPLWQRPSA
jgi:hypothetical protein